MGEKNILIANPRKLRSVGNAFCFALGEAACVLLYFLVRIEDPVTNTEKALQTFYVCFLLVFTLFMVFPIVCSLRSLYPRAILTVTDDRIILEKKREISLSDLEKAETLKNGRKLYIKSRQGEVITLNRGDVNIPLETLCYAINLRAEKLSDENSSKIEKQGEDEKLN